MVSKEYLDSLWRKIIRKKYNNHSFYSGLPTDIATSNENTIKAFCLDSIAKNESVKQ